MSHCQVDEKASDSDLRHHIIAFLFQNARNCQFKVICRFVASVVRLFKDAGASVDQIFLQCSDAPWAIRRRLNQLWIELKTTIRFFARVKSTLSLR